MWNIYETIIHRVCHVYKSVSDQWFLIETKSKNEENEWILHFFEQNLIVDNDHRPLQMSLKHYFLDLNVEQYDRVRNQLFIFTVQTDDREVQQELKNVTAQRSLHIEYLRALDEVEALLQFSTS